MTDSSIVFLATQATKDRDYRVEFLNAFAYPSGHHVFFRYRGKWLADDVRNDPASLNNRRALLLFCEPHGSEFRYHPVRFCEIIATDSPTDGTVPDDEHLVVRMRLGDFINPDLLASGKMYPALDAIIKEDNARPHLTPPAGAASAFVFQRDIPDAMLNADKGTWHQTAVALAQATSLKTASLMHICGLEEIKHDQNAEDGKSLAVGVTAKPYGLEYKLRFDRVYMLRLEYLSDEDISLTVPEIAPPIISASMPFRRYFRKYVESKVVLSPMRGDDGRCGVQIPGGDSARTGRNADDLPRAVLMFNIRGRRSKTVLYTGIIGLGLLLQTFAPDLSNWLAAVTVEEDGTSVIHAASFALGLKSVGIFVSLSGILFGLKQLPSLPGGS